MLSDTAIRKAKPAQKPFKLQDERGLHLIVTPSGGKLWRYRYEVRVGGRRREKMLALGKYPAVGLADARRARDEARALLDKGRDPSTERRVRQAEQASAAEQTFERVARRWHDLGKVRWSDAHADRIWRNLEAFVFPSLGKLPVAEITSRMVLKVVREAEDQALFSARRARQQMSAIFTYAIAEDLIASDPAVSIRQALRPAPAHRHRQALFDPERIRAMFPVLDEQPVHLVIRLALRLLALTAVRSAELRGAEQEEFQDLDGPAPIWCVPAERMKGRKGKKLPHTVPLSAEAVAIVRAAKRIAGSSRFLFPSPRGKAQPISDFVFNDLIKRAGYKGIQSPHGFRGSFSTIMNERRREDQAVIDLMLAHVPGNRVEAAYNRASHVEVRREIAQEWATLIMGGRALPPDAMVLPCVG